MQEEPREIILHESGNRPNQILGGDRELVITSGMASIFMMFALGNSYGVVLGLCFWLSAVWVLSRMGKADPLLRQIYLRHISYRPFYPAKSGLHLCTRPTQTRLWR
jgi:type IV secretion system protein VirB3